MSGGRSPVIGPRTVNVSRMYPARARDASLVRYTHLAGAISVPADIQIPWGRLVVPVLNVAATGTGTFPDFRMSQRDEIAAVMPCP